MSGPKKKTTKKAKDTKSKAPKKPTLTDAKGMGGMNAQDGFDYQVWDALARLPAWLLNPAFEGMAVEALEDVEARFFSPYAINYSFLDRYQAKSGEQAKAALAEVVKSFKEFEDAHPGSARVQTLVTPSLPQTLRWLANDPERVRKARPFYKPFPSIIGDSDDKLREDLVKEFGDEQGKFFASSVDVALRPIAGRDAAFVMFADALHKAFPDLNRPLGTIRAAFDASFALATSQRGGMLSRAELVQVLESGLGVPLGLPAGLPLHIRSDRTGPEENALEIDASAFAGGDLPVPPIATWQEELVKPLGTTARWATSVHRTRVRLSGQFRISTAFAIGSAFRSAEGFDIEIPVRPAGLWATDSHPTPSASVKLTESEPKGLVNGRLIAAVGIYGNPIESVKKFYNLDSADDILLLHFPDAVTSAVEMEIVARDVKASVRKNKDRLSATAADLFYLGPAFAAVAIGHRWNGVLPTQVFEFERATQAYKPSVSLR